MSKGKRETGPFDSIQSRLRLVSPCYTSDMNTMNLARKALLVGLIGVGLVGCRSRMKMDYHVQVRNNTGGVIQARVFKDLDQNVVVVHNTQIYPNDRGELSLPQRPAGEQLQLQVDTKNNPQAPAKMPLSPGVTHVNVTRESETGPIKLELVR